MLNKKLFTFLLTFILTLIFINVNLFAQGFEGEVEMKVTADNESHTLNYLIKGGKYRIEVGEQTAGVMVMDVEKGNMMVMMPPQKMYMVLDFDKTVPDFEEKQQEDYDMPDIQRTGETREINGYTCEKWVYDYDEGMTEAWMTDELGSFIFFRNPMGGQEVEEEWKTKFEAAGNFPMLIVNYDASGSEETRMEVTNVEPKSLSNDLFTPPADYQKMDMPSLNMDKMMDQMKNKMDDVKDDFNPFK